MCECFYIIPIFWGEQTSNRFLGRLLLYFSAYREELMDIFKIYDEKRAMYFPSSNCQLIFLVQLLTEEFYLLLGSAQTELLTLSVCVRYTTLIADVC